MGGSGLKEMLSICFAPGSVDKILHGGSYARSVRAHLLVHSALGKLIFDELELTAEEKIAIEESFEFWNEGVLKYQNLQQNEALQDGAIKFDEKLKAFDQRGPTATLWVQYYRLISIVKKYIMAERMGNWKLHLDCVAKMLPYFHASNISPMQNQLICIFKMQ